MPKMLKLALIVFHMLDHLETLLTMCLSPEVVLDKAHSRK